jgi:hypothetical protein
MPTGLNAAPAAVDQHNRAAQRQQNLAACVSAESADIDLESG